MRNLLRCQNDSINVRVTKSGVPEVLIYEDEDFTRLQAATSCKNVERLIAGYVQTAMNEMKLRNKKYMSIKFEFPDIKETGTEYQETEENQLSMFDD